MIYTTVGSLVKFFSFNKSKIMRTADWRIKPLHLASFTYYLTFPIGTIKISRYFFLYLSTISYLNRWIIDDFFSIRSFWTTLLIGRTFQIWQDINIRRIRKFLYLFADKTSALVYVVARL